MSGALLLAVAIPVVAQGGPESLLPPGFGDPEPSTPAASQPGPSSSSSSGASGSGGSGPSSSATNLVPPTALALPSTGDLANMAEAEEKDPAVYDLPPTARRSLDQVGPLTVESGGVSPGAYGAVRGEFLTHVMRASRAPFVSRWASITLRRVLLSGTATPSDVNGADLAAERASLLLRMGEADAARLLVQSVDAANFTPRLYAVAMDTYLATADPAGFCPLAPEAAVRTDDPRWPMAQAICASFSGDQGTASSLLNQAQRRGRLRGIDYRLAEKAVGSGPNSRRSVKIEWDGVDRLDNWRFGLATATNVEIPAPLYPGATSGFGDALRAWEARAPALSLTRRLAGVTTAARLGVFSGDTLVGYYARLGDPTDDQQPPASLYESFRLSYAGETVGERIKGMRTFWTMVPADGAALGPGGVSFAALPVLSRAAAALPPSAEAGTDTPWLLAAMFTGGYDRNAARWVRAVDAMEGEGRERAWALLAVGLPDTSAGVGRDRIDAFVEADASEDKVASHMLVAALMGLGRLQGDAASALLTDLDMQVASRSRWAQAIALAAQHRQKATVALLAAVGMQARGWAQLPPEHLFAILSAMRQVGLEAEARMIAAEAITRL
ncbi:hypothetical protein [Sphingobium sufflavum]|uniref:hypothetical protein n=1 Tax=Sphingobium sufflavum TaxID=1129547 RepID=UPI00389A7891